MRKENFEFIRYIENEKDARWADPEEIKRMSNSPFAPITMINVETEECEKAGLPVISDGRTVYVDGSDTHSIIFGATGSKKTRLFAMPLINMFALTGESFIVTDPKGELYDKTSGLVKGKGYETIVLNFRELDKSDYWNPLDIPYKEYHKGNKEEATSMINDFINALAAIQREGTKDRYFIDLAYSQALANLLFFIETATPEENNIYNFTEFFFSKSTPEGTRELVNHTSASSIASLNFNMVLTNEKVVTTFANVTSCVAIMLNPFIVRKSLCQVLSKSSFDINELSRKKIAVYIIVPDEKTTLHFLITAFIKQVYESLINEAQKQDDKKLPIRVNFLLDEFCNIPKIEDMPSMISAARSRNMRFFLVAQSLFQLKQKYGEDAHTIKGNCENWVFLTSREVELLEEISKLCGSTRNNLPLISTSELQRLSKEKGEVLILQGRNYPFVTELPDIDDYKFKSYSSEKLKARSFPQIEKYDVNKVIAEIKDSKRPLPFSVEVYGEEKFIGKISDKSGKKSIFDW